MLLTQLTAVLVARLFACQGESLSGCGEDFKVAPQALLRVPRLLRPQASGLLTGGLQDWHGAHSVDQARSASLSVCSLLDTLPKPGFRQTTSACLRIPCLTIQNLWDIPLPCEEQHAQDERSHQELVRQHLGSKLLQIPDSPDARGCRANLSKSLCPCNHTISIQESHE